MAPPSNLPPRSRSGCSTCRQRHRKCDEQRPNCGPCLDRNLECDYRVTLRWANTGSIDTFGISSRGNSRRKKRPTGGVGRASAIPRNSSSHAAKGADETANVQQAANGKRDITYDERSGGSEQNISSQRPFAAVEPDAHHRRPSTLAWPELVFPPLLSPALLPLDLSHGSPCHTGLRHMETGFGDGQARSPSGAGNLPPPSVPPSEDRHVVTSPVQSSNACYIDKSTPSDTTSSDPTEWVIDATFGGLHYQILQSTGEQIAFSYFINKVAVGMVAYHGGHNPFQTLAFLSLSYPILLHSILSVATSHLYNSGRSCADILSARQSRALRSLQAALNLLLDTKPENETPRLTRTHAQLQDVPEEGWGIFSTLNPREVALATIMMQMSSTLSTGMGSAEVHLRCAHHFLKDLDYLHKPPYSMFARLFVSRFALGDVVVSFLRFRQPIASLDFYMYQVNTDLESHNQPSFYELHGCSQRVLCFLARISALSASLIEGRSSQDEIQAAAFEVEMEMRVWGQKYYSGMGSNSRRSNDVGRDSPQEVADRRAQLDVVGECFFFVAQLLLMRRVFFDASESARVQFIRRHLVQLIESLPPGCGPDTFTPFPFYMAAREAITIEDRNWVRQRHAVTIEIYPDTSRSLMMASTEKVWENFGLGTEAPDRDTKPWDTPREKYIREMDSAASHFMY